MEKSMRVFISYSHQDKDLAEKVCSVIKAQGLEPFWDEGFAYGRGFRDQIKMFIAHAHVFLPIITESSNQRGWVHQEIGYALALNIPVLPVAWGRLPEEMLQELHAIVLPDSEKDHESVLRKKLTRATVDALLAQYLSGENVLYETAPLPQDRALFMTRYANQLKHLGKAAMLRQKGGLSSLHIPDLVITDPVWNARYGPMTKGPCHYRGQREERLALEHHARRAGFKLIVDPDLDYEDYGPPARKVRLETLLSFLSSLEDEPKYQVAFYPEGRIRESITILGDWFYAESVSVSLESGYRQTIFTCHAPSMQAKIDLFDREFETLLARLRWSAKDSRMLAIEAIEKIVAGIEI